ncbi:SH2 domain-containing protein 3C-like isoform X1 [Polyodon spathula]|uniref:SH2 domain-containing protein 3C-like isoform X1 n=1 Tax=Polyodon spathula TaxID=7913 RepID=UPI001B7DEA6E|nr:SH2 domain-containing protein 3C-like isoform X1 [Polyodon spathula]
MSLRKLGFKWFGSLGNISFRRSSSSAEKSSENLRHHGSRPEEGSFNKTVDDMDSCARGKTYARSCDMYSHTGTMPRKDKSSKGFRKSKGKAELSRKQSQSTNPDSVAESPLLSAMSGATQDKPKSPANQSKESPPAPENSKESASPKTAEKSTASSKVESQLSNLAEESQDKPHTDHQGKPALPNRNKSMSQLRSSQPSTPTSKPQLTVSPYCPSETPAAPLKQSAPPEKQLAMATPEESDIETDSSVTLEQTEAGDKQATPISIEEAGEEMLESDQSHLDNMDSRGEYVKFSKEKYLIDSPPEKLRRELEEELKLSSSDPRSHGWYHGRIPREVSETLVVRNGDFLVRDSLTSVGDYVLTSRWNQEVLHFKISKVLVKTSDSSSRVQYLLEHESFDTVPALVLFYTGNRRPLSQQGGAHIHFPINRTLPLRYLEASFSLVNGKHGLCHSPANQRGAYIKRRSVTMTDGLTTEKLPHSPSVPHHKEAIRNCAVSMDQIQDYRCPMSPVSEAPLSPAYSTINRHKNPAVGRVVGMVPSSPVMRRSSEPQLCPSSNNNVPCPEIPPSTHSTPAHGYSQPPGPTMPVPLPAKSYVERLQVEEVGRWPGGGSVEERFTVPMVETASAFQPNAYPSLLMPAENKPLEMGVLKRVKELLAEVDAKTTAKHLTQADCTVARILGVTKEMQKMMGVSSGLELLTLPHGRQLRLDLLERFHTMSIMIAVDLLGCTGSTEERAALLHKTIQLAAELKSNLGNMFGFAAVMKALELPQISRLEQTWMTLRQRHTEGAILYEKKLKPFMKSMNDGKESCPLSNTSFPHMIPLLSLLERGVAVVEGAESWESIDAGVDVVMNHLEAARTIAHHGGIYHTNAETKLQGFQARAEVLEVFCTEFQMRLLWGSRGVEGSQGERYEKFDKVLTALSNKLEPPVRHSEL